MVSKASAPGKVILFGEHSVVYGTPAIASAIDKKTHAVVEIVSGDKVEITAPDIDVESKTLSFEEVREKGNTSIEAIKGCIREIWKLHKPTGLKIRVWSDFPMGSGLGSSAALAVALLLALSKEYGIDQSRSDMQKHAHEVEKIIHGSPSGVDTTISGFGGVIHFEKPDKIIPLELKTTLHLVIGYTGKHGSTKKTVSFVRQLMDSHPHRIKPIIDQKKEILLEAEKIMLEAEKAMKETDLKKLGFLMDLSHGLLNSLGVSSVELENLVFAARKAGALGAKLTGGGDGGCMIALVKESDVDKVSGAIISAGGTPIKTAIGPASNKKREND